MQLHFDCNFKKVKNMDFRFGNIESSYGANNLYFTKNGKAVLPIAGEVHFSRLPREFWKRELLKMRDSGITVVSTYVFWNYHQPSVDKFDFSGDRDIGAFLKICKEVSLPVILRIGPWCHGEVVHGGFPDFINRLPKKRCDSPKYLSYVKIWWTALEKQVREYLDGETVIGIQLENEYTGSTEHIRTLRRIAEEVGLKTPFFTMTAWPSNKPDREFLPMFGGYPEAPWTQNKKTLEPKNRFEISSAQTEAEIGEDLIGTKKNGKGDFRDYPYSACEFGPGNQVTQHRRPIIGENDGYGVGFARFASGVNLLGYYMYHGGRNPNDGLWQESRRTGYPNNYPIIDYDFQAPISRFGDCRPHGDRLRLLHLFINTFDTEIAKKQPFFPNEKRNGAKDISKPSCSVRIDEQNSGYFFTSAYERGLKFKDYNDVEVRVNNISLPKINIKSGSMFFYPFNLKIGEALFDYILAQPITKTEKDGKTVCYFAEIDGIAPSLNANGKAINLPVDTVGFDENGVQIIVLSKKKAMQLHRNGDEIFFAKGNVYSENGIAFCESADDKADLSEYISLKETKKVKLPYGYYLYSYGKRKYFSLKIDRDILKDRYDVKLRFDFTGLNLQLFCGKTLIDDYFNTTGEYVIRLQEFKKYIESGEEFTIKTVPSTAFGISKVYNECGLVPNENALSLNSADEIKLIEISAKI